MENNRKEVGAHKDKWEIPKQVQRRNLKKRLKLKQIRAVLHKRYERSKEIKQYLKQHFGEDIRSC